MGSIFIRPDSDYFVPDCPRRKPRVLLAGERRRRRRIIAIAGLGMAWAAIFAAIVLSPMPSTKPVTGHAKPIVWQVDADDGDSAPAPEAEAPPAPPADSGDSDPD